MKKTIGLILCLVLLLGLAATAFLYTKEEEEPVENAGVAQHAPEAQVCLTYQGQAYPLRENLQTVLLIGTDGTEAYEERTDGFPDFYSYAQADFLMLLVLDKSAGTTQMIQLNRDTMTDIPWLDIFGNEGGLEFKQLCLAFNYGDGGVKSCKNVVKAVSMLLYDAPIDYYIQIPMSTIPMLNDFVGGVPVTITDDMTVVDPAFVQGATIRLNGTQAEKFVRARMALQDDTNLSRLRRQRDYMDSFQKCARDAFNSDSNFMLKLVEKLGAYLQSNMTAQQLSDLAAQLDKSQISPIQYAEGDLRLGEVHYEFYVDEDSLWEIVKSAYCA